MPASVGTAPGKIILFGEHAVVYGRHAIAIPVSQAEAVASIFPRPDRAANEIEISAPDIQLTSKYAQLPTQHPFSKILNLFRESFSLDHLPAFDLLIRSSIPIAGGLGSGAAVSTAIFKALSSFLGEPYSPEEISGLVYEIEKIYHGNPSGVDNTVIAYNQPIYYQRGEPVQILRVGQPLNFVIADSGSKSSTLEMVEKVRANRQKDINCFDTIFNHIDHISREGRKAIEGDSTIDIGNLLTQNHHLLQEIGVSCPSLDRLFKTALQTGARGSKLCGAGGGGNIIALVDQNSALRVSQALENAGAKNIILTRLEKNRVDQGESEC